MVYIQRLLELLSSLSLCSSHNLNTFTQKVLKLELDREPEGYFNWSMVTPSEQLQWHPCYERHECARLEVPMDPKNTSLHDTVAVAVVRDPVSISRSDSNYGGSIFFNPGGPGGSGVDFIRWAGYEIRHKIEGPKHYDLVSWDPRGVGQTTPQPSCFDNELDRQLYWHQQKVVGMADESDYALQYNFRAAKAFGQSCNSTIMRYMTTLSTVQDLLAIADALEPDVKEPLINYWGLSYGTFVGNTLASVYSHRLAKTVLDGVIRTDDFVSNAWRGGIVDTERVLSRFYEGCHAVGRFKCALYEETPDLIRNKVDKLIDSLHTSPIPVWNATPPYRTAMLFSSADLRAAIFSTLYFPHVRFPDLAQMLHDLTQSPPNTTLVPPFIPTLTDPRTPLEPVTMRPTNNSWNNPLPVSSSKNALDTERLIACTDADPVHNWTVETFRSYISELRFTSPIIGGGWAATTTTCTGWPESKRAPPHVRFAGPFGSKLADYNIKRSAHPILFIGNEADPVTPLVAARAESARHEGSVVLKTDIYGHVSVPVNPSRCVWDVLRRYWNYGELPEEGKQCKGDWDMERWELRREEDDDDDDED